MTKKNLPGWRSDLKWVTGVVLVMILSVTLGVLILFQGTDRDFAIDTISKVVDLSFGPRELPGQDDVAKLRILFERGESVEIRPVPSLRVGITEEDLVGASVDLRSTFIRRFATRLYEGGVDGLTEVVDETELREEAMAQLWLLSLLSDSSHQKLQTLLNALLPISAALMGALIFLSYGLGRLANPGLALLGTTAPGLLSLKLMDRLRDIPLLTQAPKHDADISGLAGVLVTTVLLPAADKVYTLYSSIFVIGLALLALAGIARVVREVR